MLNFCDFIQVFVFTTNHHLKVVSLTLVRRTDLFYSLFVCFFIKFKLFTGVTSY